MKLLVSPQPGHSTPNSATLPQSVGSSRCSQGIITAVESRICNVNEAAIMKTARHNIVQCRSRSARIFDSQLSGKDRTDRGDSTAEVASDSRFKVESLMYRVLAGCQCRLCLDVGRAIEHLSAITTLHAAPDEFWRNPIPCAAGLT